jgi:hypothetical protein
MKIITYLLQHAHNLVDWYPWGEDAFEAACRENKPSFFPSATPLATGAMFALIIIKL